MTAMAPSAAVMAWYSPCLISALYAPSLIRNSVANRKAFCNSCMRVEGPAAAVLWLLSDAQLLAMPKGTFVLLSAHWLFACLLCRTSCLMSLSMRRASRHLPQTNTKV